MKRCQIEDREVGAFNEWVREWIAAREVAKLSDVILKRLGSHVDIRAACAAFGGAVNRIDLVDPTSRRRREAFRLREGVEVGSDSILNRAPRDPRALLGSVHSLARAPQTEIGERLPFRD